jgi:poly-gamma-glutamate synthesis protein (capsule biosynthesis protein)
MRGWWLVAGALAACGGVGGAEVARSGELAAAGRLGATAAAASRAPASEPAEVTVIVSAVGDCALGDIHGTSSAPGSFSRYVDAQPDSMGYPFSAVAGILAEDDLTIANLEGALGDEGLPQNPAYSIRGRPAFAEMLARGSVELVSLANNHSGDFGGAGLGATRRALEGAGVGHFGGDRVDRRHIKGALVSNLGFLGGRVNETREKLERAVRREKAAGALVIVSFHWGVELSYAVLPDQRTLGRAAVDAGADLVLGHHPHVLEGIETYRGRHIVYSLGNFVFGANIVPHDLDSMIYRERFVLRGGALARVESEIIPVRISSLPRLNDFRPVPLTGEPRDRVLAKLEGLSAKLR